MPQEQELSIHLVDVVGARSNDEASALPAKVRGDVARELAKAGFAARWKTARRVAAPGSSRLGALDLAQAQALVDTFDAVDLSSGPDWSALLLVVRGQATTERLPGGLRGVMLGGGQRPRRAAVIFAAAHSDDTQLARTLLHELGHVLNLVHPFEPEVARLGAKSCMHYDFLNAAAASTLSYDAVELAHLRAAGLDVIPGGRPFHSAEYWRGAPDRVRREPPDRPLPRAPFLLSLQPPPSGWTFALAQPVLLGVELTRNPSAACAAPLPAPWLLDAKAAQLEVQVRRLTRTGDATGGPLRSFLPVAQRCYAGAQATAVDGALRTNINLTYGLRGFTFPDPGSYELRAVLHVPDQAQPGKAAKASLVVSQWQRVHISEPKTEEERDFDMLLSHDVGLYWALGGYAPDAHVREWLDDYVERRQGRSRVLQHPIATHAVRARGLDALRTYVRGDASSRPADPGAAVRLLQAALASRATCFDLQTRAEMQRVIDTHAEAHAASTSRPSQQGAGAPAQAAPTCACVCTEETAGDAGEAHASASTTTAAWNVLLYMAAGAPNLRYPAQADLRELQALAPRTRYDKSVRILAQLDEAGPTGTKRLAVVRNALVELCPPAQRNVNTGSARALREFVEWAAGASSARHTLLVLWGHSQGVGFGVDPGPRVALPPGSADFGYDFDSSDALSVAELGAALKPRRTPNGDERLLDELRALRIALAPRSRGGALSDDEPDDETNEASLPRADGAPFIDILGFDSCYESAVEIAAELGRSVGRLLAAQGSQPLVGWDYRALLRELTERPGLDPATLGTHLSELSATWQDEPALTLLNVARSRDLLERMHSLVEALERAARDEGERRRILETIRAAPSVGAREFLDLRELCRGLERRTGDPTLQWTAARVARFLAPGPGSFVEALPRRRPGQGEVGGVSIYCPFASGEGPTAYVDPAAYERLRFNRWTGWAELMRSDVLRMPAARARSAEASARDGGLDTQALALQVAALLLAQAGDGNGNGATYTALPTWLAAGTDGRDAPPKPSGSDKSGPIKPSGDDKSFFRLPRP